MCWHLNYWACYILHQMHGIRTDAGGGGGGQYDGGEGWNQGADMIPPISLGAMLLRNITTALKFYFSSAALTRLDQEKSPLSSSGCVVCLGASSCYILYFSVNNKPASCVCECVAVTLERNQWNPAICLVSGTGRITTDVKFIWIRGYLLLGVMIAGGMRRGNQ